MSQSTPINQLPSQTQPQMPVPMSMQPQPQMPMQQPQLQPHPVEADIDQEIQDVQRYPPAYMQQRYMQQQQPQVQYAPDAYKPRLIDQSDIKLFGIILVIYVILSNEKVIELIGGRIPCMGNSIASLVLRAILVAALVVVVLKVMK